MYGYELTPKRSAHVPTASAMGRSTLYPLLYNLEARNSSRVAGSRAQRSDASVATIA
ncbi:MAG: hypothetical protein IPN47_27900 [Gemmatimonadetes bacterium]|nr:hypothetical protein [Gemmatimonadota bacterium]